MKTFEDYIEEYGELWAGIRWNEDNPDYDNLNTDESNE